MPLPKKLPIASSSPRLLTLDALERMFHSAHASLPGTDGVLRLRTMMRDAPLHSLRAAALEDVPLIRDPIRLPEGGSLNCRRSASSDPDDSTSRP